MRVIATLIAVALAGAARAEAVDYALDPTHSFVTFELLHFGTSTIRGRFGPLTGQVMLDRAARRGRVQVVVATAAVSTGVPLLDASIRAPEMLAVEAFPQAYFVAERFEFDAPDASGLAGAVRSVRGEFTLRGQGQPLTLTAERFRCYTSPLLRREVCGGDFTGEFNRSAFGITHSLPFVADTVRLKVQVEAIRQ